MTKAVVLSKGAHELVLYVTAKLSVILVYGAGVRQIYFVFRDPLNIRRYNETLGLAFLSICQITASLTFAASLVVS